MTVFFISDSSFTMYPFAMTVLMGTYFVVMGTYSFVISGTSRGLSKR